MIRRSYRAVIKTQLGRAGKRFAAAPLLRRWKKHLFLHADVLEQTRAELGVGRGIDICRVGHGALKKSIEAPVIVGEIAVDFSRHDPLHPADLGIWIAAGIMNFLLIDLLKLKQT